MEGTQPASPGPVRPYRRTVVSIAVALLFAGIALGQLQSLLSAMHLSGKTPYSIGGLNHLVHFGADSANTQAAIETWRAFAAETAKHVRAPSAPPTATPESVVWWAWAVDSFAFVPLYVALFATFLLRVLRELGRWRETTLPLGSRLHRRATKAHLDEAALAGAIREYELAARIAFVAAFAAGIADEIENVANLLLVEQNWVDTHYTSTAFNLLIWILWFAAWAKWILAIGTLVACLLLGWALLAGHSGSAGAAFPQFVRRAWHLRLQVAIALLVVVIFFAHEQMPDMVLRWTPDQLGLDVALAALLAMTLWFFGHQLLTKASPGRPGKRTRDLLTWLLPALVIGLAALQLVLHLAWRGGFRAGWGLGVPAAMLLAIALLSVLTPNSVADLHRGGPASDAPAVTSDESPPLPRFLAATVIVGIAAGILHASFAAFVYQSAFTWWAPAVLLAGALGAAAGVALGRIDPLLWASVFVLAVFVALALSDDGELNAAILVAFAILLFLGGLRLFFVFKLTGPAPDRLWRRAVATIAAVLAAFYVVAVAAPAWTGVEFSAIGVLFLFFTIATMLGALVSWVNPVLPVPRALRVLGVKTFPTVTFLVMWFVVAGILDKGGYHNARVRTDTPSAATPVTLGEAFGCWLDKNGLARVPHDPRCTAAASGTARSGATPLFMIATTGGGIRAAYWTDLVLTCAFESDSPPAGCSGRAERTTFDASNRIFAASGISGGSLGLASYGAYVAEKDRTHAADAGWVDDRLQTDALSASGAWWLFVELPRAFLQYRGFEDRAAVLERGWERKWPQRELTGGLFDLWRNHPHAPLLLLNGTSVTDGCRFETSVLDGSVRSASADASPPGCRSSETFDNHPPGEASPVASTSVLPGTKSLADYLCGQKADVRLSTAALLSARFPFVNPSGRVPWRCPPAGKPTPVAYVVDGGYLDTSGASPIEEVMNKLTPMINDWNRAHAAGKAPSCVVPLMIQIDNGFPPGASSPPRRPGELLVPPKTLFATRGAREAESRIGAALEFTQRAPFTTAVNRYARFVNAAHPGPHAPLGWTQSEASADELVGQLAQETNVDALTLVRRWLTPGALKCARS